MRKSLLIVVVLCFAVVAPAKAQNISIIDDLGLSIDDFEDVEERIQEKVEDFYSYLQCLAGRDNVSHAAKMEIYDLVLHFFIGEGEPFTILVPNPNGGYSEQIHEAVTMSTINPKYKKYFKRPMTTYLSNLIKRSDNPNYRYKQVVIEAADAVRVDNFIRVGDGRYMATAHILQHFIGYGEDGMRVQYEDYRVKTITIYINRTEYLWQILLGDVECDDVW